MRASNKLVRVVNEVIILYITQTVVAEFERRCYRIICRGVCRQVGSEVYSDGILDHEMCSNSKTFITVDLH